MLEMDKTRDDVRPGASRFSPARRQIKQQSGHKLLSALDAGGGDINFTEKSKKDRIKRLSVVGRANSSHEDYEMGCFGSHEDDELRPQAASPSTSSKKIKLPKRFLDDCNSVDHTSVPRKLRSAMKKRSCESVSPPLPDPSKQNHKIRGLELSERDGSIKKSRLDMKQGSSGISPKRVVAGPITKDEQEVVETLYALAGLFSKNDSTDKSKLGDGFPEANSFAFPEAGEGTRLAFKVPKDIAHPICPSMPAEVLHASPSSVDRSPGKREFVNDDTLSKPCVSEQHNLEVNEKLSAESFSVPQMKLQTMPLFSETEQCMETRLKKAKQQEVLPSSERKLEIALGPATNSESELQHAIKEGKKNGLAFWPGLCPLPGAEISSPPKSSDTKSPVWLDAPKCVSKPASSRNSFSTEKVSRGAVDRKSWKRCAAHVYISRLIQILQISERRDGQPVQLDQLSAKEGLNRGVLVAPNNLIAVRNGYNEVLSGGVITSSALGKSPNEVRVGAIMHKRLHQDQQQAALPSKAYNLQKQSFDFLSLSAGGGGNEAENSNNRCKNGLESMPQLPIPYLRSFPHNQTPVPFSLHQTHYSSSPSPDQLSATAAQQVPFQLSPYLGNTFCVISQTSSTSSAKLQQQQQRQHQQQIWAAQLAAQYRPGVTSAAASLFPSWQNGRQNSSSMVQSPSSLELLGPKYLPISPQQQQQLMTITSSLSPARINRQHNSLPSGYEENGIGLMLI